MEVSGGPFYSQAPNEYKAGWVLELVWTFWTRKKMESRPCCPVRGLFNVPTGLPQLTLLAITV
jgi:hypothetical protein